MKILFRVDAGGATGLGHFYRSLDVADVLTKRGHDVVFSHLKSEFWTQQLRSGFNYPTVELDSSSQENKTSEYILKQNIDVYYVDGIIDFTHDFFRSIGTKPKVIFYQNVGKARNLANVFISPAFKPHSDHSDDTFVRCKKFEGLEYFCFNPLIRGLKHKSINPDFSSLAVSAGGSDPENTLLRLYQLLGQDDLSHLKIKIYYGSDFMHKNKIPVTPRANVEFLPFNHSQILEQDALISSFGVSVYEFLCLGMPILTYGHVARNAHVANLLATETKALLSLGKIKTLTRLKISEAIANIAKYQVRKTLSCTAIKILDLNGAERVVEIIENGNLLPET